MEENKRLGEQACIVGSLNTVIPESVKMQSKDWNLDMSAVCSMPRKAYERKQSQPHHVLWESHTAIMYHGCWTKNTNI